MTNVGALISAEQEVGDLLPYLDLDGPRTTVDLAHSLGLTLIAEGSRTRLPSWSWRLGCDVAQGYHISNPCRLGS